MPSAVGPAQAVATSRERFIPGIHSVQGINSSIDAMRIRGTSFLAVIGEAVAEVTLERTIQGASSLKVMVLDPSPKRRFLRSPLLEEAHELILDGLRWKLVKVSNQGIGSPIELTYEPLLVYVLKKIFGPHKAFRDQMTRAEFGYARWLEGVNPGLASREQSRTQGNKKPEGGPLPKVKNLIPGARFVSPELHVVQPIGATPAQVKERQQERREERKKGVGDVTPSHLTINGKPPTKQQTEILNRMLETADEESAPSKVMEALVVTCIDESVVGTLSSNLLEQEPFIGVGTDHTNPEESADGFLRGYKTASGRSTGAIAYNKANPGASVAQICTAVQNNRDGATPYERFLAEGKAWVAAFGGGSEVNTESTERYAFDQPKKESNWAVMVRLAAAVDWHCFESAGWTYFLDEPTLMRSPRRMLVSDLAPGIIDTTFDYDVGKENQTLTVEAQANAWGAPPGSVALVERHGPADGDYLVQKIESHPSKRSGIVTITLKREVEPLPEPLPSREKSSSSFGSGSDGAPEKVQEIIAWIDKVDAAKPPYVWGGGHGSFAGPSDGQDCSGFVSAAVHAAGYLSTPLTSANFASTFPHGEGEWVTIYGDDQHVLMKVKYPDGNWRWAETSSANGGGAGWVPDSVGEEGKAAHGSNPCHPPGL